MYGHRIKLELVMTDVLLNPILDQSQQREKYT